MRKVELTGFEVNDETSKAFKGEVGKAFDYAMLRRLMALCGKPPEGASGFSLHVRRDVDGTGVVIRVEFRAGTGDPRNWYETFGIVVDGAREYDGGGNSTSIQAGSFSGAEKPLAKVPGLSFDTSFELCYGAHQGKVK